VVVYSCGRIVRESSTHAVAVAVRIIRHMAGHAA
jgi:hypothetical protein